ncbi:DNA polymerase III subunit delta [Clostridium sp. LBM24168]
MIDASTFQQNIRKEDLKKCYVFCGLDEKIIGECIKSIIDRAVNPSFLELNYIKFDGNSLESFSPVINACQTLPFMSNKKVVLVYRAYFINDNSKNKGKLSGEKEFKNICEYLNKIPEHCILILYDIFGSKRDKVGRKMYKIDKQSKDICTVKVDKLKGRRLENKVEKLFNDRKKDINKVELRIFCSLMQDSNFSIIENEVEKLCNYTYGRDISKDDIKELFVKDSDEDIFDLVNSIANKRVKEALSILDELIYKGIKINYILTMVERQFGILLKIKIALNNKIQKKDIMSMFGIRSDYAYSIMVNQSKKFTLKQLKRAVEFCMDAEQRMKNLPVNEKTEMELLIINTTAA